MTDVGIGIDIGIIGGSGLYAMEGLTVIEERAIKTPFGDPSDPFVIGEIDTPAGGTRVALVAFADPICASVSFLMGEVGRDAGATTHMGGVYVNMEGPQFSTRAESLLYRSWNVDVIGMTNLTEARLAREAEICYATMALVTDYDCWHPAHDDVDIEQILGYLRANAAMAQKILRNSIPRIAARKRDCACVNALQFAILTDHAVIPETTKQHLAPLIRKYVK